MEEVTLKKVSEPPSLVSKTYSGTINRLKGTDLPSENAQAWVQRMRRIHCRTHSHVLPELLSS